MGQIINDAGGDKLKDNPGDSPGLDVQLPKRHSYRFTGKLSLRQTEAEIAKMVEANVRPSYRAMKAAGHNVCHEKAYNDIVKQWVARTGMSLPDRAKPTEFTRLHPLGRQILKEAKRAESSPYVDGAPKPGRGSGCKPKQPVAKPDLTQHQRLMREFEHIYQRLGLYSQWWRPKPKAVTT